MKAYLSIAEVAERLSVSQMTIRRMVAGNAIVKPVRVGGQLRWSIDQLAKWEQSLLAK